MNIVIVMSGGVGARFGAVIPKQYNLIAGKPVIDYVLDAVDESKIKDKVVIVMDQQWIDYSEKIKCGDYDIAPNGSTRFESMYNALKLIKGKYSCEKIVIVDAVGPFVYSDLIDDYFAKLENYDSVITAQKITGGFTDIHDNDLDREDYIITQSPEGFNFELLYNNFNLNFPYQETAGMLPKGSRRYYNFDFKNNLKLTYDFELAYAEFVLKSSGKVASQNNIAFFDKNILYTTGLKQYLLRNEKKKTLAWIDSVYINMPRLIDKWEITSFLPNQISRFGLVLQAKSRQYGDVIIKFIPEFIGRYQRELEAIRILPKSYMCKVLDVEEECNCMLLERIIPARFASFDENIKMTDMFHKAIDEAVPYDQDLNLKYIPNYLEELKGKAAHLDDLPYCKEEVGEEVKNAIELYIRTFEKEKLYVLHGDLHEQNILDNGERFIGIDPNGEIAPIEFECVRFIRNDMMSHPSFGFDQRFDILVRSFSRFVNVRKLIDAFIIDMAFCTFNSVFENEKPDVTNTFLEFIRIAKLWKKNNF